jgi:hypothetical protein
MYNKGEFYIFSDNIIFHNLNLIKEIFNNKPSSSIASFRESCLQESGKPFFESQYSQDDASIMLEYFLNPFITLFNLYNFFGFSQYNQTISYVLLDNGDTISTPYNISDYDRLNEDSQKEIDEFYSKIKEANIDKSKIKTDNKFEINYKFIIEMTYLDINDYITKHKVVPVKRDFFSYLIIHIKRFKYDYFSGINMKDSSNFRMDEIIELSGINMKLKGYIYHSGSINYGHYVFYLNLGGIYYLLDDVSGNYEIDYERFKRNINKSYIYLYERI